MTWIEVAPAYGRDYTSQKAVQADWDDDKDFMVTENGPYGSMVNRADALAQKLKVVVRYANRLKVYSVK